MLQDHMPDNVLDALEKVSILLGFVCTTVYILNSKQIRSRDLFMCLTVTRVVCKFIKLFVKFKLKHSPLVPENNFFETLKHILKGIFR